MGNNTWTDEEDKVLLENVKKFKKKRDAHEETCKILTNRTERGCSDRWRVLSKLSKNKSVETVVESAVSTDETKEKASQPIDIIEEISKIVTDLEHNKIENARLQENNDRLVEDVLRLGIELSQSECEKQKLKYQLENIEKLIQSATEQHTIYIKMNESLEEKLEEANGKIEEGLAAQSRLENRIKNKDAEILGLKRVIEELKAEMDEYKTENNTIMNLFNKARRMFTGVDNTEKTKFKMDSNGNLERVG